MRAAARARAAWQHARAAWQRARHSLQAQLTLLFLALALLMTLAFAAGMQAAFRSGWQDYARPLIADYIDRLATEIGTPPDIEKAQALTRRLPLRIRIDGPAVNWSSHPDVGHDGRMERAARGRHDSAPDADADDHADPTGARRGASPWRPTRLLADGHRIRFGLALLPRDGAPEDRPRLIGWVTLAAMLALVGLAWARVRWLLRPLDAIRAGALRYGAGDFTQPIPARARDELGDLAQRINGMADGLRGRLDAKRDLLLAISHELRSPLTRARLNAELVDEGPARDALLHDLADMRDLITDLLESERLANGHAALMAVRCDPNALVREAVDAQFGGAGVALQLEPDVPPTALDTVRIRMLLRNLIDNALRHTGSGTAPPVVSTRLDGRTLLFTVRDHGPGVDEAQLPLLAQAFYRPDSARQRSTGGVGLGLYLCRLVAQAHGGSMACRNATPGLEVTVRLPLSPPPRDA